MSIDPIPNKGNVDIWRYNISKKGHNSGTPWAGFLKNYVMHI